MVDYITEIVSHAVRNYSRSEVDLRPILKLMPRRPAEETPVPFPRKVWMTISWYLADDVKTYENMAMTCKGLYNIFVQQKVLWYFHPLRGHLKSPRIFTFPIFRVVEFIIPDELENLLSESNLPSVMDVLAQYDRELGIARTPFESTQRKGD